MPTKTIKKSSVLTPEPVLELPAFEVTKIARIAILGEYADAVKIGMFLNPLLTANEGEVTVVFPHKYRSYLGRYLSNLVYRANSLAMELEKDLKVIAEPHFYGQHCPNKNRQTSMGKELVRSDIDHLVLLKEKVNLPLVQHAKKPNF